MSTLRIVAPDLTHDPDLAMTVSLLIGLLWECETLTLARLRERVKILSALPPGMAIHRSNVAICGH